MKMMYLLVYYLFIYLFIYSFIFSLLTNPKISMERETCPLEIKILLIFMVFVVLEFHIETSQLNCLRNRFFDIGLV